MYQRKNLYNQEPSRSSSGETVPEDDSKTSWLEFFYFASIAPYFILGSVVDDGVGQDSAERGRGALLVAIYRKPGIHVQGQEMSARLSL